MNIPNLTEPGVKYWLSQNLKDCKRFRDKHIGYVYNLVMFGVLILLVAGFLTYKYKGHISPEELEYKDTQQKEYILSKLQQLALYKKQSNTNMITDLPMWDKEAALDVYNRKI